MLTPSPRGLQAGAGGSRVVGVDVGAEHLFRDAGFALHQEDVFGRERLVELQPTPHRSLRDPYEATHRGLRSNPRNCFAQCIRGGELFHEGNLKANL